jgi:ADP-dependent NAD(P)H-hydrate dehydratase
VSGTGAPDGGATPRLPARPADGHKGRFGTVGVVGGCAAGGTRMLGAPVLAGLSALRCGCGKVKLALPEPLLDAGLGAALECTGVGLTVDGGGSIVAHEAAALIDRLVGECRALVVGPGLGPAGEGTRALVLRALQNEDAPVVIDADGLNAIAQTPQITRDLRAASVLTPHPGEFRNLCRGLGLKGDLGLDRSRGEAASGLAQRLGCVVVLKGKGTVVSDGAREWVCPAGSVALATAGTGDVLSGVIASLAAQSAAGKWAMSLFDVARLGVLVHARAGENWARRHGATGGMLARDLLDELPGACEAQRG